SRSYREKDLKRHLDSDYAIPGPKPALTLSYLYEPPAKADDEVDETPGAPGEEPFDPAEEEPLDDEFQMDFEIGLARDLLAEVGAPTRKQMLKGARRLVERRRGQEIKKLSDKLAAL